ncbi:MAG: pilus assembly protein N-terminal domain-containing protein [Pirellulaceae bacterium]
MVVTLTALAAAVQAQAPEQLPDGRRALEMPSPEVRAKMENLIGQVIEPEAILRLEPTRSKLMQMKRPITRVAITNPDVLEITQFSPTEFEIIGRESGETTLTLWFADADGGTSTLRYLVEVMPDESEQIRADLEYSNLQDRLNELFPNSQIQLIPLIDKLIVRGQARDSEEATQIMSIIRAQVGTQNGYGAGTFINPVGGGAVAPIPGAEDLQISNVVSLLQVPGEQQVMLKVRVAELTRTALRELGTDFTLVDGNVNIANFLTGGATNLSAIFDAGDFNLFVRIFNSNAYGKILAEPTLVTLSGHTANFIAGGEFAVPTAVGVGGIGAASTTFRGFGTQLAFTPTVIDKDRIRLTVAPSFSELNAQNSVDGIPGLNTRAVVTTVDLREGQWLAIAGLIQDEQGGEKVRLPYIGDVPILGAIFGSQSVNRSETELIVLVSPELVHPLEPEQVSLSVPGFDVTEPTDYEFWSLQWIQGFQNHHHRSTVWPQYKKEALASGVRAIAQARLAVRSQPRFQRTQQYFIAGPQGFSD